MSEDLKVFMLLMNPQGKLEDIDLGSLYVNIDDNGFIHELTVEPYLGPSGLDDYEALFDCFNQEVPEVPMSVSITPGYASTRGFFDTTGYEIDLEIVREELDGRRLLHEIDQYSRIVRSAYRLYERVTRGEPAFVGFTDPIRHRGVRIDHMLQPRLPLPYLSREAGREHVRKEAIGKEGALYRLRLRAQADRFAGSIPAEFVLDACVRSDRFPHRLSHILGVTDTGRPLVVSENGDLRISDTKGFFTNIMSRKLDTGQPVIIWADGCQKSSVFRIDGCRLLMHAGGAEETREDRAS